MISTATIVPTRHNSSSMSFKLFTVEPVVRQHIVNSTVVNVCRGANVPCLSHSLAVCKFIDGLPYLWPSRLKTHHASAVRVGKHRMSGAVAQALWLRSQKCFHSFFPWALGMIPSHFQIENWGKKLGKNFPPGGLTPNFFSKRYCHQLDTCKFLSR